MKNIKKLMMITMLTAIMSSLQVSAATENSGVATIAIPQVIAAPVVAAATPVVEQTVTEASVVVPVQAAPETVAQAVVTNPVVTAPVVEIPVDNVVPTQVETPVSTDVIQVAPIKAQAPVAAVAPEVTPVTPSVALPVATEAKNEDIYIKAQVALQRMLTTIHAAAQSAWTSIQGLISSSTAKPADADNIKIQKECPNGTKPNYDGRCV